MKTQTSKIALALALGLALLLAVPAAGQTFQMRIKAPFAFVAGGQMHSAGVYWIHVDKAFRTMDLRADDSVVPERIQLKWAPVARKTDNGAPAIARFRQYNGTYTLQGVWQGDERDGYEVRPSQAEKELAKAGGSFKDTDLTALR